MPTSARNPLKAIEVQSKTDEHGNLKFDIPLQVKDKSVRILILFDENEGDNTEYDWLKYASASPAYNVLNEPDEDIYSLDDWEQLNDKE